MEGIYSPKNHVFGTKVYIFFALSEPPMAENGIAVGSALIRPRVTWVSNLGWIGHSVHDLWHFL